MNKNIRKLLNPPFTLEKYITLSIIAFVMWACTVIVMNPPGPPSLGGSSKPLTEIDWPHEQYMSGGSYSYYNSSPKFEWVVVDCRLDYADYPGVTDCKRAVPIQP